MAVGTEVYKESDGKSVGVTLGYATAAEAVAYIQSWLGITARGGKSGEPDTLAISQQEYQFEVPASLAVTKGQVVCIDLTNVAAWNSHQPPEAAYNTNAASATNLRLFKATAAKDANHVVTAILLAGL
jgi:hypothetical protein